MPKPILISASCWRAMSEELSRVCPAEGVMVPLVALELAAPRDNPCATVTLETISRVVIARLIRIPPALQHNSSARVSVMPHTNHIINNEIVSLTTRSPRLRACAYLHSHPFAVGTTHPSRGPGCDYEGHMLPLLQHNRSSGLATCFSFIACRASIDRPGWRLLGFGLDPRRAVVELGAATVVADDDPQVQAALAPSLWSRPAARAWLRRWQRTLRRLGHKPVSADLFGGYVRLVWSVGAGGTAVAFFDADFPSTAPWFFLRTKERPAERFWPQRFSLCSEALVRVTAEMQRSAR